MPNKVLSYRILLKLSTFNELFRRVQPIIECLYRGLCPEYSQELTLTNKMTAEISNGVRNIVEMLWTVFLLNLIASTLPKLKF